MKVPVQEDLSVLVHDADVHSPCVQVDPVKEKGFSQFFPSMKRYLKKYAMKRLINNGLFIKITFINLMDNF